MKCLRCKDPADRGCVDGYCSVYCQNMAGVEAELFEAQTEVARLTHEVTRLTYAVRAWKQEEADFWGRDK